MHPRLIGLGVSLFLALGPTGAACASAAPAPTRVSIPAWAGREFRRYALHDRFQFYREIEPAFYRGDFDGDGRVDCALLVREKSSDKVGLVILHRRGGTPFILGAGKAFGNGGDDWAWLGEWRIVPGETVPGGKGGGRDALLVEKPESAGGIVYWDGTGYEWLQHGD